VIGRRKEWTSGMNQFHANKPRKAPMKSVISSNAPIYSPARKFAQAQEDMAPTIMNTRKTSFTSRTFFMNTPFLFLSPPA